MSLQKLETKKTMEPLAAIHKDSTGIMKRKLLKSAQPLGRTKAATILEREEKKQDKRLAVAEAVTKRLQTKYAKGDPTFGNTIGTTVSRFLVESNRRVVEADIAALEIAVKKMSLERKAERDKAAAAATTQASQASGTAWTEPLEKTLSPGLAKDKNADLVNEAEELKKQDEWVLLNALSMVEFEEAKAKEKERLAQKKHLQRKWLDGQRQEKHQRQEQEKQLAQEFFEKQLVSLNEWKQQEQLHKQQQKLVQLQIRAERDGQLNLAKQTKQQQVQQKQLEEAQEVQHVQRLLRHEEELGKQKRMQQHERMRQICGENQHNQELKRLERQHEQQHDVELMHQYAQRLEKEEHDRQQFLAQKLLWQDKIQNVYATSLQQQVQQKARQDELRALQYQHNKQQQEQIAEQLAKEQRMAEAMNRKKFLESQTLQKQQEKQKEIQEELKFAQTFHQETQQALAQEKQLELQKRQKNRRFQAFLVQQMQEQEQAHGHNGLNGRRMLMRPTDTTTTNNNSSSNSNSTNHSSNSILPRHLMNSRERLINADLLKKLDNAEVSHKVFEKLSPTREQAKARDLAEIDNFLSASPSRSIQRGF